MSWPAVPENDLRQRIDRLPRTRLAALPTACEELPRLADHVGVDCFLLKRDDLTGLALGGNKSRAMEFILGDAVAQGSDVLVAGGGVEQSNHARQCVAAATRAGLDAVVVLQRRQNGFRSNGNLLVLQLLGGTISWLDTDPEIRDRHAAASRMEEIATELTTAGRRPYLLKSSLHPLSVVAYADAAMELVAQIEDRPTRVYVTSEGAALGGLVLAARAVGLPWDIRGVDWRPTQSGTPARLSEQVNSAATMLELQHRFVANDFYILDGGGPAYGEGSPASWAAIDLLASLEGVLLDPVYTAKGMAGTLADLADDPVQDEQVVFIHTGGTPALFAYEADLQQHVLAGRGDSYPLAPAHVDASVQ